MRADSAAAYVSVDLHFVDNRDPFIYKTADFGKTWKRISAVTWTVVQRVFHDLVVSTYGRGLHILDDITPLEQMAKHRSDAPVVLFEPRAAYRFVRGAQAPLNFSLKAEPKNPVEFEILDSQGAVIRKLEPKEAKDLVVGINRVSWDLRHDSPRVIALRTVAPDNSHIWQEPRFRDADSRPITHWGSKPGEVGPIAAPGAYSVRLKVDGQSFTQPLTVLSDPHSPGSAADIDLSVKTLVRIRDDISRVSDTVNQMEWLRKQIEVAEALDKKLQAVESRLVSPALRNSDDKYFVQPYRTYLDLIWLNAEVGTGGGDVAGSADFAPSAVQLELLNTYETDAAGVDSDYRNLLQNDVPPFDQALERANLAPLLGAHRDGG